MITYLEKKKDNNENVGNQFWGHNDVINEQSFRVWLNYTVQIIAEIREKEKGTKLTKKNNNWECHNCVFKMAATLGKYSASHSVQNIQIRLNSCF